MRESIQLREKRADLIKDARKLFDTADRESRELSTSEERDYDKMDEEIRALDKKIERLESLEDRERSVRLPMDNEPPPRDDPDDDDDGCGTYRSGTLRSLGRGEVRVLAPNERVAACPELRQRLPDGIRADELSIGRVIRAIVTGDWQHAKAEQRAMGVGADSGGGFLLPDTMSAELIDLARNKAQVFAAGARTVPMESNTLTLAKVTGDLTAAWKAENAPGTSSDMTFGAVKLASKTLFAQAKVSVELVEDAGNVEQLVNDVLSSALGLKLDLAALTGDGPPIEPLGIRLTSGIQIIDQGANGAAITDFSKFGDAVEKVLAVNGPDRGLAAIFAPRTWGTIDRYEDTTGQPLRPPASYESLRKLVTNQVPINLTKGSAGNATDIYVGDFSQVMVGMRTSVRVEASRAAADTAESAFQNMQVWIRAYLRADVALAKPDHLVLIDGVIP